MRPLYFLAGLLIGMGGGPVMGQASRPVTVETVLNQEGLGSVRIDPQGRWIVVERRAAWSAAATYRLGLMTSQLLTGLEIHDVSSDRPPRVIADPGHATGYVSGPFSPSGEKMVVYRLTEDSWRLGVLSLATGSLDWFPITPEHTGLGRSVAWRSDTELVVIARQTDDLPLVYRLGWQTEARKSALWRRFEMGHAPSAVHIPSGAHRDSRAQSASARLLLVDVRTGRETTLAAGDLFDLELSPDGRSVAALSNAEDLQADDETLLSVGAPSRRRRLVLVDLLSGRATAALPEQDLLSHLLTWSPDSRSVLVFGRRDDAAWAEGQYWRVEVDGTADALALPEGRPWVSEDADGMPMVRGGWSGSSLVVQIRTPRGDRLWHGDAPGMKPLPVLEATERLVHINDRAWIERSTGLTPVLPHEGEDATRGRLVSRERTGDGGGRARSNPAISLPERTILLRDGCLAVIGSPPPQTCLGSLPSGEALIATSPSGDFAITQVRDSTGSARLIQRGGQGARLLATFNLGLDQVSWGRIEAVPHQGPNGERLTSWLLLPAQGDETEPPPVVVLLYPGAVYPTAPAWLSPGSDRRHINPAVLAAGGYAVLVPSLPRPGGKSPGLQTLAARIQSIVAAAAAQASLDTTRVALIGHSYGGHGALLAATQTDDFRAVIASAGYADLSRVYALTPHFLVSPDDGVPINALAGWAETGQGAMGVSFTVRPEIFVENSPLYRADRLRTPTLLIEGELDPAGGDALFGALYRQGREAALVTYAGEGHVFVSPANLRDLHARILDWLDLYMRASDRGDPGLPGLRPNFEHRPDQQTVVAGAGDQPRLR